MTKGQVESLIKENFIRIHKEVVGKGPKNSKITIIKNYIIVETKGLLTNIEEQLLKQENGIEQVKNIRNVLRSIAYKNYISVLEEIFNTQVYDYTTKLVVKDNIRYDIFICNEDIEEKINYIKAKAG